LGIHVESVSLDQCITFPGLNEFVTVSGLGDSLRVEAWLEEGAYAADAHTRRSLLAYNNTAPWNWS